MQRRLATSIAIYVVQFEVKAGAAQMKDVSALTPEEWPEHHRTQHGYSKVPFGEDAERLRVMKQRFSAAFDRLVEKFGSLTQSEYEALLIKRILFALRLT